MLNSFIVFVNKLTREREIKLEVLSTKKESPCKSYDCKGFCGERGSPTIVCTPVYTRNSKYISKKVTE